MALTLQPEPYWLFDDSQYEEDDTYYDDDPEREDDCE